MYTQNEMNQLVPIKLHEIEEKYNVEILWAVESGSRAWGFASPDSDFDIRFLYKCKPEKYLSLYPSRDVIEFPIDEVWDVNGWDLDKALKLLQKSNPTLYEWLNSPIIYFGSDFKERITPIMKEYFSIEKMLYHYLNTARNNIRDYLQKDKVIPKKYFYALRPILACLWIIEYKSAPPVLFSELLNTVLPDSLRDVIDKLTVLKINGSEKLEINPIPEIDMFLKNKMFEIDNYLSEIDVNKSVDWNKLNEFFFNEIGLK